MKKLQWKALFRHMGEMKHYLIASTLVFVAGLVLGVQYSDRFQVFLDQQLAGMEQLVGLVKEKDNQSLWLFIIIFLNNAIKSLMFVYLGLFFGIIPLMVLLVNGLILGYVIDYQLQEQSISFILKGLLPHGVFEIPAIIVACAYGIRLGILVIQMLGTMFAPSRSGKITAEFKRVLGLTKPLILLIVGTLLFAALVESTVTLWLLSK
ncbi:stage II sporulation protein M [Paenibacillus sp. FJAT-26967]|uniref:stage II sporulation protein M n=1 Tax=Paenibacillus sp. FJAT-26967 TaxID=1729690 RepID=UPI000B27A3D7|nr:stage II sporulation protein M [Paenibacillus sp. FJAT-26967]